MLFKVLVESGAGRVLADRWCQFWSDHEIFVRSGGFQGGEVHYPRASSGLQEFRESEFGTVIARRARTADRVSWLIFLDVSDKALGIGRWYHRLRPSSRCVYLNLVVAHGRTC